MVGKWHLCPTDEMNLASTRRNWPSGRGFERWYGFLGAETNQWYPDLVYDNHPVDQPRSPEEGYHLTEDLTDKAIEFIQDAKAIAPEKPFFLYYAPGACHAPHHAPKEWIDKFKGQFDMGYEAMREQTLARQKQLGIVPADTELPPINPIGTPETRTGPEGQPFPPLDETRPWDSLSAEEKRLFARMAEVYAGFLAHADHHIGRLLDFLEVIGERENTLVILVSDNGASGEGGPNGSVNEMMFMNGIPDDIDANLAMLDELGGTEDLQPLPERLGDGVQHAVQDVEALRVQRRHRRPVHHLVAGRDRRPAASCGTSTTTRSTSCRPSSTSSASSRPRRSRATCRATSTASACATASTTPRRRRRARRSSTRCSAPAGIWHDGWKAVTTHPTLSGWSNFNDDEWELYHTDVDRSELHNLAAEHPEKLRELVNLWFAEAGANDGLPARRPVRARDHPHAAAAARPAAGPLRLLPRLRRGARGPGRQHPQPLLHDRRPRRHPRPGRARRAVRPRVAVRWPRPLRQGQPAALRQQLRRHVRAEGRRHASTSRPGRTSSCRRRSTRTARTRRAWRPGSCRCTTATRRSAKARSRLSPAGS